MENVLEIMLNGGWTKTFVEGKWDDYSYDGTALMVLKDGKMIFLAPVGSFIYFELK